MLAAPLAITTTSAASTKVRPRLTITTIRRRSNRSAATPPITPNRSTGRYSLRSAIETRNGSCVSEATSSGPAETTTPSPIPLAIDADSSQRNFRPSLVGAMASVSRAVSRTGRRIAIGDPRARGSRAGGSAVLASRLPNSIRSRVMAEKSAGVPPQDPSAVPVVRGTRRGVLDGGSKAPQSDHTAAGDGICHSLRG